MKHSVLLTLLPILASLSPISLTGVAAHSHHHHHHHHPGSTSTSTSTIEKTHRKTLGFGLIHPHAEYNVLSPEQRELSAIRLSSDDDSGVRKRDFGSDDDKVIQGGRSEQLDGVARKVAIEFVKEFVVGVKEDDKEKEGEGGKSFFIRDDSYTDPRTLTSHVYIRQIINGLEVVDGDVNVNVGRDGTILSWGSSFYPGDSPSPGPIESTKINKQDQIGNCKDLKRLLIEHDDHHRVTTTGKIVLDAAKTGLEAVGSALFGDAGARFVASHLRVAAAAAEEEEEEEDSTRDHLLQHIHALCDFQPNQLDDLKRIPDSLVDTPSGAQDQAYNDVGMFSAKQALAKVFRDLLPSDDIVPPTTDLLEIFTSHHEPNLHSKYAHAEPPIEVISNVPFVVGADLENSSDDGQVKSRLVYHQVRDDESTTGGVSLKLCWRFDVPLKDNWYDIHVDTVSGEIVSAVDYVSDAPPSRSRSEEFKSTKGGHGGKQKPLPGIPNKPHTHPAFTYSIFPFGVNDPSVGNISSVTEPWDKVASPAGWHAFPDKANLWLGRDIKGVSTGNKVPNSSVKWTNATTTIGNNVFAQEDWAGQSQWLTNSRPQNSSTIFDYEYGEPDGLRPQEYVDFAVTQLFYTSNMYHDLLYRLGFDEVSGNFQMENWDKGGRGGDAVLAYAQAGEGTNNANFATPPDGTQPRMRMYLWSTSTPYRDGDLEAGIVIHEYSHGLSTRLTGGPMNSGCLGYGEAGGMGEGWGDAMATFIRQIEEYSDDGVYSMGAWAANDEKGIRNYRYSSNSTINPSTYKTLDKPGYWGVHAIGEVWAEFLFVLEELLIKKHGFSSTLFPPEDTSVPNEYYRNVSHVDAMGKPAPLVPIHGNTLMVQLIIDGMKLQPCRPSFANARDAIIAADLALTGGENTCDIWAAFAGRGLGTEAALKGQLPWGGGIREEDFTMPKACTKKGKGKH